MITGGRVRNTPQRNTPQHQLFSAGSHIQTARRHLRHTSKLQSCLQRLHLQGAQASVVGRGRGAGRREAPRGTATGRARLVLQQYQVPRSQAHTPRLGSVPTREPHGCWEVKQSRQCLNTSPSSRRFPAEDEPAAQGKDSWNQEALKPILSLPIDHIL